MPLRGSISDGDLVIERDPLLTPDDIGMLREMRAALVSGRPDMALATLDLLLSRPDIKAAPLPRNLLVE